jgi:P27 family predicted phage terminase small subunit
LVGGNPGRRPTNKAEPKPEALLPDPPPELSADALTEWQRIAPRLLAAGMITSIDRAALAAYCQAYGRWAAAERHLARMIDRPTEGLLISTKNGNAIHNPLVSIANKALRDMVVFAAELGMTPSGRSRVKTNYHDRNTDPADEFFPSS